MQHRWATHKSPSEWKLRSGMKLYQAFINYGLGNFIFEVLEETDNLKEREQYYIEQLNTSYNNYRAKGRNKERYKETKRRCSKEWHEIHRNEQLTMMKDYHYAHRDEHSSKKKDYNNRLCFYEGETLTFGALSRRFSYQGIAHPYKEAKRYLIQ